MGINNFHKLLLLKCVYVTHEIIAMEWLQVQLYQDTR